MSDRLTMAALRFAANIERLNDPADILEALHQVARIVGLNAFGAWKIPTWALRNDRRAYSICVHPSVPAGFFPEYWELYEKHGRSFLAALAWRNRGAFTMTEALRIMKPTGADRWLQQMLYRYSMRDVFYVPNGNTMVVYWSAKPLRLDVPTRAALQLAASATAARLHALPGYKAKQEPDPGLSARQRAVLGLLSLGHSPHEIGERLEISHGTVKEHIERASRKLGAKSAAHAVAEALRRYVVIGLGISMATAAGICDVHEPDCWIIHILEYVQISDVGADRV